MAALFPKRLLGAALIAAGCYAPGNGVDPPLSQLYFPVGLVVSPGATRLYVLNSDFDLQYNGGSLQVYDLQRLRALLPRACDADADCDAARRCDLSPTTANRGTPTHWCVDRDGPAKDQPCGTLGEKGPADLLVEPGICKPTDPVHPPDGGASLIKGDVGIGAFATDVVYASRPNGPGGRLFIPVRGDSSLHWIDVDDDSKAERTGFELRCGQQANSGRCDDAHHAGTDPEKNTRGLRMPSEPFGIAVSGDGGAITVTHQTEGAVSLFVQNGVGDWGDGVSDFGNGPQLQFITGDMPARPIGIAVVPRPAIADADPTVVYHTGFLVTYRDASQIELLRYFDDQFTAQQPNNPARPFLERVSSASITSNSLGFDSRGLAVDGTTRATCEDRCKKLGGDLDCETSCAGLPLDVFIANRTPASLLVGKTRVNVGAVGTDDLPGVYEVEPMPFGPSRVIIGDVIGLDGHRHRRAFIVCFDSRAVMIYDPDNRRVETIVTTGRGPHALALDIPAIAANADRDTDMPAYAYAYVGHFTDSWIGVVDLDQRHRTYGKIIMTVGYPSAPRASK